MTLTVICSPFLKDSLAKYANGYPEFLKVRSCKLAEDGQRRVGFGCHESKTLKSLYESKDCKIIRYCRIGISQLLT